MLLSPDHWPLPDWKARDLPQGPIVIPHPLQDAAFGTLGPQMHCMCPGVQLQDELICDTDKYQNIQWTPPQGQCQENFHHDGETFPRYRLERVA
jgi:hypothetical protein